MGYDDAVRSDGAGRKAAKGRARTMWLGSRAFSRSEKSSAHGVRRQNGCVTETGVKSPTMIAKRCPPPTPRRWRPDW